MTAKIISFPQIAEEECAESHRSSATARGGVLMLEMSRQVFQDLCATVPWFFRAVGEMCKLRDSKRIGGIPLFEGWEAEDLDAVVSLFSVQQVEQGTSLLVEGEKGMGLLVIVRGVVRVFGTKSDGTEVEYAECTEGKILGEVR